MCSTYLFIIIIIFRMRRNLYRNDRKHIVTKLSFELRGEPGLPIQHRPKLLGSIIDHFDFSWIWNWNILWFGLCMYIPYFFTFIVYRWPLVLNIFVLYFAIKVYEGLTTSGELLLQMGGSFIPRPVVSKTAQMLVRFITDQNGVDKGFMATYVGV